MQYSRKTFLKLVGAGALAAGTNSFCQAQPTSVVRSKHTLTLGLASYTLRSFSLDEVIAMAKRLQLNHLALKSMHMPLDSSPTKVKEMADKVRQAGLNLYGAGVIYMKSEAEVDNAFRLCSGSWPGSDHWSAQSRFASLG